MNLPSLSVIVPNYNHAKHLPTCLMSVLNQSVKPSEILVLDDASTDESVSVIKRFAEQNSQIRLIANESNLGVLANVNKGIDLAASDYVFSLAADDVVLPGFFEKSLNLLASYPQAGLSCTIGDWREDATGLNWHVGVGMATAPIYLSPETMVKLERKQRLFIASHTAIMKRGALIEAGKYRSELRAAADWFNCCVIGFKYGICFVPEPLGIQNIIANSYYQRCRRDKTGTRLMFASILDLLTQPQFEQAAALMRSAGSLYLYGAPMLKFLLSRPQNRRFLTPILVRNGLWHSTKRLLKNIIPTPLGNLYFRFAGYRASVMQS